MTTQRLDANNKVTAIPVHVFVSCLLSLQRHRW